MTKRILRAVFGAHGQLAVGVVAFVVSIGAWVYGARLTGDRLLSFLFHVSMGALVLAAYAIVATALGYRATERVEAAVVENLDVGRADAVNVNP